MSGAMGELAGMILNSNSKKSGGGIYPGTVESVSPLRVSANGIPHEGNTLMVNPTILDTLAAGDAVVTMTEDKQVYYLICKVVSAGG